MKASSSLFTSLAVLGLLSACTGGSQSSNAIFPYPGAQSSSLRDMTVLRSLTRAGAQIPPDDLYVSDISLQAVLLFDNKTYSEVGVITNGISQPDGVFLDKQGRLYVADATDVTEYAPGNTSAPIFTYSVNMASPLAVTADSHGNLYEGDGNQVVNEYFQQLNATVASCSAGGIVIGIAVDSSGDVFVDAFLGSHFFLAEYPGGLGNCASETILPVGLTLSGGIALDHKRNLLVADGNEVAVIDPPYTSISGTIGSGFSHVFSVSLNRENNRAFVTDGSNHTVTVVSYPSGKNVTVLGTGNGLSNPLAAVDQPNAVY